VGSKCDWYEWHVESDRDGWFIVDEYGEDLTPTRRFTSPTQAEDHLKEMVQTEIDNYDGPGDPVQDAPDFPGFSENH
jgi:hypothetical protein